MISQKDQSRLEELAKKQMELANSERNQKLKKLWLKSNTLKGERPMVTIETRTFADDIFPQLMECEGEEARKIEKMLLLNIVNTIYFDDDTVVRDYIPVLPVSEIVPYNIPVVREMATDGIGHHFKEQLTDIEADFGKLSKSTFTIDLEQQKKNLDYYNNILGHIIPAKYSCQSFSASLTQQILHIASMETFFFGLMDCPELVKKMMDMLADDYIEYAKALEANGLFYPMCADEHVDQGSIAFTDELNDTDKTAKNMWFSLDSQETVGVSPDVFKDVMFPAYEKVMKFGGLVSYGCCEPVDPIWDNCLSKVENLRKVSISPWCNEEFMAERLKGTKVVYFRKPSPNFIGVGTVLDEEAVREHIKKTVVLNKGRSLEFAQRDVYKVNHDINKVKRYVEIIREECENNW